MNNQDNVVQPVPHWWDITDPTPEVLGGIADRFNLHRTSVQDCLDPEHFPKIEKVGDTVFMIARCFDTLASAEADDLLGLTRKVAFFLGKDFLITVHRGDQPFIIQSRQRVEASQGPHEIMVRLMKQATESFNPYLERLEQQVERLERELVTRPPRRDELIALYGLRTRISVIKRQALHTLGVIREFITVHSPAPSPWLTDLKETAEGLWQYCDELMEDVQNLLALHLSLSSHRTNETMRFLTVVSLFFMPLTFIVGIYGMNFDLMPELNWRYGYAACWAFMLAVSFYIYWKVRSKGWLERE